MPTLTEQNVMLCVRMLQYSVFADHTQDRRPNEVKEALKFFFTDAEINQAVDIVCGRAPTSEGVSNG